MLLHSGHKIERWLLAIVWILTLMQPLPTAANAPEPTASNQTVKNYQALAELEDQLAGEPSYDYLLGIAALQSGKPAQAILALERLAIVAPENSEGKLALAAAYLQMGEMTRLQDILKSIDPSALSPESRSTWESLLQRLELANSKPPAANQRSAWNGYLRLTSGYDDNLNSGMDSDPTKLYPGISAALVNQMLPREDPFLGLRGLVQWRRRLTPNWSLFADLSAEQRRPIDETNYETTTLAGHLSLNWSRHQNRITAQAGFGNTWMSANTQQRAPEASLQWTRDWDKGRSTSLFTQGSINRYRNNPDYNNKRWLAGFVQRHPWNNPLQNLHLQLGAYGGQMLSDNNATGADRYTIAGFHFGSEAPLTEKLRLFLRAGWEKRAYQQAPIYPLTRRQEDRRLDLSGGINVQFNKSWSLNLRHDRVSNHSSNPLDAYSRDVSSLNLQWGF
ncbi:MAG: tetratricopeptide repeat protein [Magnetococcales bacterium]|nr:tetratricopeptide repeat protein [Magnetococcales bacterium]